MGMLDGLLVSLMGGMQGASGGTQQNPLLQIALQLMQKNGGLSGILRGLRATGVAAGIDTEAVTRATDPTTSRLA